MKDFTLYPYNRYLFYLMLVVTVCMLAYALSGLIQLEKTVKAQQPAWDQIEKELKLLEIKSSVLEEERERKRKQNRIAGLIIPALLAVRSVYRSHQDYHGVSGYTKAIRDVLFGTPSEQFKKKLRN
ncbi:MAG: hypothetical protein ACI32N_06040 [Bulleidia sp.]